MTAAARVHSLHVYPVKSCRGVDLTTARLAATGLAHDRLFMVADEEGEFLSQRTVPSLARISVAVAGGRLRLSHEGSPALEVSLEAEAGTLPVGIWGDRVEAVRAGEAADRWLSSVLERPCQLVRMPASTERPVSPSRVGPGHRVGFADGYPLLILSTGSLAELNRRLDQALPMNRFRPNLVVDGVEPFAEDTWRRIRIGGVALRVVKPCARCVVTTTDQHTGLRGREPLATLARFRRAGREVLFGQNAVHGGPGEITVGDEVEVLETGPAPVLDGS